MGRNRKSGRAVKQRVYDILGNVIGIKPDDVAVAVAEPPPEPAAELPFEVLRSDALTQSLESLRGFSKKVQKLYENAENAPAFNSSSTKESMRKVQLDPDNPFHRRVFAAMMGILSHSSQTAFEVGTSVYFDASSTTVPDTNAKIRAKRVLSSYGNGVWELHNSVFRVDDDYNELAGAAHAMLRQQVWAARQYEAITGRKIKITTEALSDNGENWNGAHVWPKVGYTFPFTRESLEWFRDIVEENGFTSTNTADLMSEQNSDGVYGIDAWRGIMDRVVAQEGNFRFSGYMDAWDDNDRGLQVLQNYGRRSGITKSGSNNKTGENGFTLTADDEAILRQLWIDAAQMKRG